VLSWENGWNDTYTPGSGIAWNRLDMAGLSWIRRRLPLLHETHGTSEPPASPRAAHPRSKKRHECRGGQHGGKTAMRVGRSLSSETR
jgi:hypothetical protein